VRLLAFTSDGQGILAAFRGLVILRLDGVQAAWHPGYFYALAPRPGGAILIASPGQLYVLEGERLRPLGPGLSFAGPDLLGLSANGKYAAGMTHAGLTVLATEPGGDTLHFTTHAVPTRKQGRAGVGAFATALDDTSRRLAIGVVAWVGGHDELQLAGDLGLWDVKTGQPLWRLPRQEGWFPHAVAFCGGGKWLAVGWVAADARLDPTAGKVDLYDAATGKWQKTLQQGRFLPLHLVGGPGGRTLLGLCTDATHRRSLPEGVKVPVTGRSWDLENGAATTVLQAYTLVLLSHRIPSLPYGDRFAVLEDEQGDARLWDLATGQSRATPYPAAKTYALPLPEGKGLVLLRRNNVIRVWDATTGKEKLRFPDDPGRCEGAAVSPDGRLLATAGSHVILWDLVSGQERLRLPLGTTERSVHLTFSADGRTLVAVITTNNGASVEVKVWSPQPSLEQARFSLGVGSTLVMHGISPGGQVLGATAAGGTGDGVSLDLHFWDLATGRAKPTVRVKGYSDYSRPAQVVFDPSGRFVAVGGKVAAVTLVEVATGKQLAVFDGDLSSVVALAFADGGQTLVVVRDFGAVQRWDLATRQVKGAIRLPLSRRLDAKVRQVTATFALPADRLRHGVAVDAVGTLLAVATPDGSVELWDLTTGRQRAQWTYGIGIPVTALALSADGTTVAVALQGHGVHLWELATDRKRRLVPDDRESATTLVFAPDGKRLAVGTWYGLYVYAVADGTRLAHWSGGFSTVCFSADGRSLFALGGGMIRMWELPP
jgi:WD40 repeat protein